MFASRFFSVYVHGVLLSCKQNYNHVITICWILNETEGGGSSEPSFVRLSLLNKPANQGHLAPPLTMRPNHPPLQVGSRLCINSGVLSVSAIPLSERLELKVAT